MIPEKLEISEHFMRYWVLTHIMGASTTGTRRVSEHDTFQNSGNADYDPRLK